LQVRSSYRQGQDNRLYASTSENSVSTSVSESKSADDESTTQVENRKTTCDHCSTLFASRTALFRHIRTDPKCSLLAGTDFQWTRQSIAFSFGYCGGLPLLKEEELISPTMMISNSDGDDSRSEAQIAGILLRTALVESLNEVVKDYFNLTSLTEIKLISSSQASVAKSRHRSLAQEAGCAAIADVLSVNVQVPKLMTVDLWSRVVARLQERIKGDQVQVFAFRLLESTLPVERKCTQRVFHYLLPLSWLPDCNDIESWWQSGKEYDKGSRRMYNAKSPPDGLKRFKDALRSAECTKFHNVNATDSNVENGTIRLAAGRFGELAKRERRPWHNYADPSLRGDASPNNEPVWRVVDRARIVDVIETPHTGDLNAVVEIKGDDFVKEQIRRIMGTAVAIAHGWLPETFLEMTTRADTFIETPLAPPGRLYVADNRFHFDELKNGRPLFDSDQMGTVFQSASDVDNAAVWLQTKLLEKTAMEAEAASEAKWLDSLQNTVGPRIQAQLAYRNENALPSTATYQFVPAPNEYTIVLKKLQHIITTDLWPETSVARSSVIRQTENSGKARTNGSFTIVNPKAQHELTCLPLANAKFPDLVQAIFELEEILANQARDRLTVNSLEQGILVRRAPSSHCAVNCNAEFTPHVDSGRGSGQSLSMIVGLGDYTGGGLYVEGDLFDIRFKPIEFDGWKLRHWTNQFQGERFSLVWFTPELKG
jgi:tRNA U38,U39,U40 pseudouridine synthase TruA